MTLAQLGWALVTLAAAALAAVGLHFLLDRIATRLAREGTPAYRSLLRRLRSPTRAASALVGLLVAFAGLRWPPSLRPALDELLTLAAIAVIAWLLTSATQAGVDMVGEHWDLGARDNLAARKAITRAGVVRRVLVVLILIVALAAMLMSFPEVRALGASLLASAGLVGLIAGLAAQPLLTNLIAGLQIALTQPIRIDDVVVVNGDWGQIEEIDAAFVVVRIWDLRRLVVPLSYFLQTPFENWTYKSADLLGYVYIYADYAVSVDGLRQELLRLLEQSGSWDGKAWSLQVTGADERALQMRALFSAQDSGQRWDLMVYVLEHLVSYLHERYPEQLPRIRVGLAPQEPPAA